MGLNHEMEHKTQLIEGQRAVVTRNTEIPPFMCYVILISNMAILKILRKLIVK